MHAPSAFQFGYRRSSDQDAMPPVHHPVVIVGAGPVGMTLALDLADRGIGVVLLDDADRIGEGSRAICFAKRTLEIFDRIGVAEPMLEKGVVWQKGRVFLADREVYDFDLLPDGGHRMPAFINLQQYYVEGFLVDAIAERGEVDLRWRNKVVGIERRADGATIAIATPDGPYVVTCDWLVCCDGARSPSRGLLGLDFAGEVFDDQFLIADVKMRGAFPTERWFWFDPPFHSGQSALLHRQPDDVWRIDLQLGPATDAAVERRPENVTSRIARMLGHADFTLEWVSIYRFQCRRLEKFVHGRVIFAGDSAHQVSPFGARGANSGIQDADNLGWKLAAVIKGTAPVRLIDSYEIERGQAADENIGHSTRSTDFIAPRSATERQFRNAALELAEHAEFAKRFVNSGRLSLPTVYDSPLSTTAGPTMDCAARLGGPAIDLPLAPSGGAPGWLLGRLGPNFTVLHVGGEAPLPPSTGGVTHVRLPLQAAAPDLVAARYGTKPGTVYVIRPDQHICACLPVYEAATVMAAIAQATAVAV
jgi:3-(3-hydroxy-phenyl)propionate hydroxylase